MDERNRLRVILESIDNIHERIGPSRSAFMADELIQVWGIHHLQIIGLISTDLDGETKELMPAVSWRRIDALRDGVFPEYWNVDLEMFWSRLQDDLPVLEANVRRVLDTLPR